ncbi:MAG: Cof-type HAD-IIB family hydrolase [Spirochaetaceae bacterium]|nr:Cof-type HAD-IIB family hydrolase [Spirochaetaceae bacterium]
MPNFEKNAGNNVETLREMAKNVKVIFFDIDDTLRVKDTKYLPPSVPKAIRQLQEKGIHIGIASGRAYYGIAPEVIALSADYYVTINGQYVRAADGTEIYANPIPTNAVEKIVAWAKASGIEYGFVGSKQAVVSKWTPTVADAVTVVYGKLDADPSFYKTHRIYQMWSFTEKEGGETLPSELAADVRLVRWHPHSSDIVPMNGSKATGISHVLERLAMTKDQLMVFGDELNDIEMFQYAGFSVAMGNAHEALKPLATFITKHIEKDGVAYALETLGLIH